jgi:hypothetical protein
MARIAVLFKTGNASNEVVLQTTAATAELLKMELIEFYVRGPGDFEKLSSEIANQKVDAVSTTVPGFRPPTSSARSR